MNRANRIQMMRGGRFISHHDAAEVYYDSRCTIIKAHMEGGGFFELVKERQADGSYGSETLSVVSPSGDRSIVEYPRNQLWGVLSGVARFRDVIATSKTRDPSRSCTRTEAKPYESLVSSTARRIS
jgi:hypothetical protein